MGQMLYTRMDSGSEYMVQTCMSGSNYTGQPYDGGPGGADSTDDERAAGAVDTPLDAMRAMLAEAAALRLPMVGAEIIQLGQLLYGC